MVNNKKQRYDLTTLNPPRKPPDPNPDAPWAKYARPDFGRWLPGEAPSKIEKSPPPDIEIERDGLVFYIFKSSDRASAFNRAGRPALTWGDVTRMDRTHPPGHPIPIELLRALLAMSDVFGARVFNHRRIDA